MERYELGYLLDKLSKHVEEAERNRAIMVHVFKRDNPGVELREYMQEDFSLPLALYTLCGEVKELKEEIWLLKASMVIFASKIEA